MPFYTVLLFDIILARHSGRMMIRVESVARNVTVWQLRIDLTMCECLCVYVVEHTGIAGVHRSER